MIIYALAFALSALGVITMSPAVTFAALVVWALWFWREMQEA